jgi:hypothetical protein
MPLFNKKIKGKKVPKRGFSVKLALREIVSSILIILTFSSLNMLWYANIECNKHLVILKLFGAYFLIFKEENKNQTENKRF